MRDRRIFLLGMGAQKAGTTWLYHYLSSHPRMRPGPLKEYHALRRVFNVSTISRRPSAWKKNGYRMLTGFSPRFIKKFLSYKLGSDLEEYVRFFSALLGEEKNVFTADMTPGHVALPDWALKKLAERLAGENISLKAVLLIRDPVERVHSAARMFAQQRGKDDERSELEELEKQLQVPLAGFHGGYNLVLENLQRALPRTDYFVELYEDLFAPGKAEKIVEWLGFEPHAPPLQDRVNVTLRKYQLRTELQKEIAVRYSAAYLAAADYFGREKIRQAWPSARFVL